MYWFINIFDYTTNTTFYSLFIPMTNKHLITWLVIVWVITAVWLFVSFVSNADAKKELSDVDLCIGSGSVWACTELVIKNWKLGESIQKQNAKAKEVLCKNWLKEFCFQ